MTTNNGNGFNRSSQIAEIEKLPLIKLVTTKQKASTSAVENTPKYQPFDRPVILQQTPILSRLILFALLTVTTGAVIWACYAKIEQAIPATGKLEPTGTVKEVQSPVNGVVKAIYVADGQRVKKGDRLLSFDPTAAQSQSAALKLVRDSLLQENQFYTSQINNPGNESLLYPAETKTEIVALTKSRAELVAENRLYRGLLGDRGVANSLNQEQLERL